jgi:hypothetical protein
VKLDSQSTEISSNYPSVFNSRYLKVNLNQMNKNMGAAKPLITEITHYLGQLNEQRQKAVLGVVKTFAKEQSWWDDKSYRDAMDKRFVDLESGKVKGVTLDDLEAGARQSYMARKPEKP